LPKIVFIHILFLFLLQTLCLGAQFSFGLLFEARTLTDQEKTIAEKDYLSIIQKCNEKINAKIDLGAVCDALWVIILINVKPWIMYEVIVTFKVQMRLYQ